MARSEQALELDAEARSSEIWNNLELLSEVATDPRGPLAYVHAHAETTWTPGGAVERTGRTIPAITDGERVLQLARAWASAAPAERAKAAADFGQVLLEQLSEAVWERARDDAEYGL